MYTLKPTVSATAAAANALAMRRNENVKVCRDSIFCHNVGMKFALGSGAGHAANARKRASSFSSLLPCIGIMSFDLGPPVLPGIFLFLGCAEGLQNPLPGSKQPDLKSIFVDIIYLFQLLQRKPFH